MSSPTTPHFSSHRAHTSFTPTSTRAALTTTGGAGAGAGAGAGGDEGGAGGGGDRRLPRLGAAALRQAVMSSVASQPYDARTLHLLDKVTDVLAHGPNTKQQRAVQQNQKEKEKETSSSSSSSSGAKFSRSSNTNLRMDPPSAFDDLREKPKAMIQLEKQKQREQREKQREQNSGGEYGSYYSSSSSQKRGDNNNEDDEDDESSNRKFSSSIGKKKKKQQQQRTTGGGEEGGDEEDGGGGGDDAGDNNNGGGEDEDDEEEEEEESAVLAEARKKAQMAAIRPVPYYLRRGNRSSQFGSGTANTLESISTMKKREIVIALGTERMDPKEMQAVVEHEYAVRMCEQLGVAPTPTNIARVNEKLPLSACSVTQVMHPGLARGERRNCISIVPKFVKQQEERKLRDLKEGSLKYGGDGSSSSVPDWFKPGSSKQGSSSPSGKRKGGGGDGEEDETNNNTTKQQQPSSYLRKNKNEIDDDALLALLEAEEVSKRKRDAAAIVKAHTQNMSLPFTGLGASSSSSSSSSLRHNPVIPPSSSSPLTTNNAFEDMKMRFVFPFNEPVRNQKPEPAFPHDHNRPSSSCSSTSGRGGSSSSSSARFGDVASSSSSSSSSTKRGRRAFSSSVSPTLSSYSSTGKVPLGQNKFKHQQQQKQQQQKKNNNIVQQQQQEKEEEEEEEEPYENLTGGQERTEARLSMQDKLLHQHLKQKRRENRQQQQQSGGEAAGKKPTSSLNALPTEIPDDPDLQRLLSENDIVRLTEAQLKQLLEQQQKRGQEEQQQQEGDENNNYQDEEGDEKVPHVDQTSSVGGVLDGQAGGGGTSSIPRNRLHRDIRNANTTTSTTTPSTTTKKTGGVKFSSAETQKHQQQQQYGRDSPTPAPAPAPFETLAPSMDGAQNFQRFAVPPSVIQDCAGTPALPQRTDLDEIRHQFIRNVPLTTIFGSDLANFLKSAFLSGATLDAQEAVIEFFSEVCFLGPIRRHEFLLVSTSTAEEGEEQQRLKKKKNNNNDEGSIPGITTTSTHATASAISLSPGWLSQHLPSTSIDLQYARMYEQCTKLLKDRTSTASVSKVVTRGCMLFLLLRVTIRNYFVRRCSALASLPNAQMLFCDMDDLFCAAIDPGSLYARVPQLESMPQALRVLHAKRIQRTGPRHAMSPKAVSSKMAFMLDGSRVMKRFQSIGTRSFEPVVFSPSSSRHQQEQQEEEQQQEQDERGQQKGCSTRHSGESSKTNLQQNRKKKTQREGEEEEEDLSASPENYPDYEDEQHQDHDEHEEETEEAAKQFQQDLLNQFIQKRTTRSGVSSHHQHQQHNNNNINNEGNVNNNAGIGTGHQQQLNIGRGMFLLKRVLSTNVRSHLVELKQ